MPRSCNAQSGASSRTLQNQQACWVLPVRNLVVGISFVLVVVALATLGYWLAGWPLGDAFYMVVVTVYTVGYGEVHPVDTPLLRAFDDRDDRVLAAPA